MGPQKVLSAFVGPGVQICDGDRIVEKNFWGPRKFCHVLSAFVGPGVRICDKDRIVEKNFWGPRKFCRLSSGPGVQICDWRQDRGKKLFGAPKVFFPLLRNQE